jgi:uncharacterized membrane protein
MKNWIRQYGASLMVLVLALGFAAYAFPYLPEQIPSHFNIEGIADAWSAKWSALTHLPMINGVVILLLTFSSSISPRGFDLKNSQRALSGISLAITFLLMGIYVLALDRAVPELLPFSMNLAMVLSGFCFLIGNYLSKVERNFFMGFRTPWALASESNWLATHRFGAKLYVAGGLIAFICSFWSPGLWLSVAVLILAGLAAFLYSFIYFQKHEKKPLKT